MTSNTGKWSYQSSSLGHTSGVLTEPVSFFGSSSTILVLLLLIEERQTNIMLVAKCSVGGGGQLHRCKNMSTDFIQVILVAVGLMRVENGDLNHYY